MKKSLVRSVVFVGIALPALLVGCAEHYNYSNTPEYESRPNAAVTEQRMTTETNVDNTARNMRDRHDSTLTPADQGNSETDLRITQQIRKAIVNSDNHYSITARNIKIITVNGKVTLRGPVNTDREKAGIETIANSIAGDGNVNDQLEVKMNP